MNESQVDPSELKGLGYTVLVRGVRIDEVKNLERLAAMHAAAARAGVQVHVAGDLDSEENVEISNAVIGKVLAHSIGGAPVELGNLESVMGASQAEASAIAAQLRPFENERAGTFLVAAGPRPSVRLAYGVRAKADSIATERDGRQELVVRGAPGLSVLRGSDNEQTDDEDVVVGVRVAYAGGDVGEAVALGVTPDDVQRWNSQLSAAGVADPKFFLVFRYS